MPKLAAQDCLLCRKVWDPDYTITLSRLSDTEKKGVRLGAVVDIDFLSSREGDGYFYMFTVMTDSHGAYLAAAVTSDIGLRCAVKCRRNGAS
jgi:hypothetical protein